MRNAIIKILREFYERSYGLDWDDNILIMPTEILLEKKSNGDWVDYPVSTEKFREIREELDGKKLRLKNNNPIDAFEDFRTEIMVKHVKEAIDKGNYGPVFNDFKEALLDGATFGIITARGVPKEVLRNGIKTLIKLDFDEEELETMFLSLTNSKNLNEFYNYERGTFTKKGNDVLDEYIDNQILAAVSSDEFKKEYSNEGGATNPEKAKTMAFKSLIDKKVAEIRNNPNEKRKGLQQGFSDDDKGNLATMEKFIINDLLFNKEYDDINIIYTIIDTSNPNKVIKTIIMKDPQNPKEYIKKIIKKEEDDLKTENIIKKLLYKLI